MNQKPLIEKIKDYIAKTEEERELSDYCLKFREYLSMSDEAFQSKLITVETKLDFEKSKFTIFISIILIAFLTGFTEKMLSFLKMVSAQMFSVEIDKALVLDGIYWLAIILYFIILLIIFSVIWYSLRIYFNLLRDKKILDQVQKMRERRRG